MKKSVLFLLFVFLLGGTKVAHALDLDVVAGFNGSSYPSAKFYYPLKSGMSIVGGFSAQVPGRKYGGGEGRQVDADILIGLNSEMPLVGFVDMYFLFDDDNGVSRTGNHVGSDLQITKFVVSKKWLYPITDQVDLGVAATLGEIALDGSRVIGVMTELTPVVGVTISIL